MLVCCEAMATKRLHWSEENVQLALAALIDLEEMMKPNTVALLNRQYEKAMVLMMNFTVFG